MCCNDEHEHHSEHHPGRHHGEQCDCGGHHGEHGHSDDQEHHGGHECGCGGRHAHTCCCEREHRHGREQCGCGGGRGGDQGRPFRRRFHTREERLAALEAYLKDLQAEVKAVEEQMAELKADH